MKGPWQGPAGKAPATKQTSTAAALVALYKDYISPIDGSECPMCPSCSQYSMACFEKHGFFMGWIMTWDRLYRCGHEELKLCPRVFVNGEQKCYDPVESNDFWWSHDR